MAYTSVKAWCKAIADAIRSKDKTTAVIPHQDFPARIAAIPTGGDNKPRTDGYLGCAFANDYNSESAAAIRSLIESQSYIYNMAFMLYSNSVFEGALNISRISPVSGGRSAFMYRAFYGCKKITEITLPGPSSSSDPFDFGYLCYNCSALTSFTFTGSWYCNNFGYAFYGCTKLETIDFGTASTSTVELSGYDNAAPMADLFTSWTNAAYAALKNLSIGKMSLGISSTANFAKFTGLEKLYCNGFVGSTSIKSIVMPATLKDITIQSTSGLVGSLTSIDWSACTSLPHATLATALTRFESLKATSKKSASAGCTHKVNAEQYAYLSTTKYNSTYTYESYLATRNHTIST